MSDRAHPRLTPAHVEAERSALVIATLEGVAADARNLKSAILAEFALHESDVRPSASWPELATRNRVANENDDATFAMEIAWLVEGRLAWCAVSRVNQTQTKLYLGLTVAKDNRPVDARTMAARGREHLQGIIGKLGIWTRLFGVKWHASLWDNGRELHVYLRHPEDSLPKFLVSSESLKQLGAFLAAALSAPIVAAMQAATLDWHSLVGFAAAAGTVWFLIRSVVWHSLRGSRKWSLEGYESRSQ